MSIQKLSDEIKSLFCSNYLTSYKNLIEELVYNSLDAGSTSIAIRVDIDENKIQVIDNGFGIPERDFKLLAYRYATSKYINVTNFKSAPNTYGFCGQSLASIIEVSRDVKITSRSKNGDTTWAKIYHQGKNVDLVKTTTRPSKGTTVEINGFLYNLSIQRKSINKIQEITTIKTFLKQVSLVHNDVSLSLRDDSKNEIIFKIHKNRDVYKVIKLLFNVDKENIQELIVEKNEYKAYGYIGKSITCSTYHWIFLNKRFLNNYCELYKIIWRNFSKYLNQGLEKIICKTSANVKDYGTAKNCIPFYVIFLTCPYYDYAVYNLPKQTVEFKDWTLIEKIIEKLIKFYVGDIKLKEINLLNPQLSNPAQTDTKEQVKKIIHKILGHSTKKVGVSQMQNGVKGKLMKRKKKKQHKPLITKILPNKQNSIIKYYSKDNLTPEIRAFDKQSLQKEENKTQHTYNSITNKYNILEDTIFFEKSIKKDIHSKKKHRNIKLLNNRENDPQIDTHMGLVSEQLERIQRDSSRKICYMNERNNTNLLKGTRLKLYDDNIASKKIVTNDIEKGAAYSKNLFYRSHDLLNTILGTQKYLTPELLIIPSFQNTDFRHLRSPLKHFDNEILTKVTFQSHNYNNNIIKSDKVNNNITKSYYRNKNQSVQEFASINFYKGKKTHFLGEKSNKSFAVAKKYNSIAHSAINKKIKVTHKNNQERSKWLKYNDTNNISGYTIEDTKSESTKKCFSMYEREEIKKYSEQEKNVQNIQYTYTVTSSNLTMNINSDSSHIMYSNSENCKSNLETNNMNPRNVVFVSNFERTGASIEKILLSTTEIRDYSSAFNSKETDNAVTSQQLIYLSNSEDMLSITTKGPNGPKNFQELKGTKDISDINLKPPYYSYDEQNSGSNVDPLNVCQIAMTNNSEKGKDDELSILNSSLLSYHNSINKENQVNVLNRDEPLMLQTCDLKCNNQMERNKAKYDPEKNSLVKNVLTGQINEKSILQSNYFSESALNINNLGTDVFSIKNRFRFIPKGMSPIFENKKTKTTFDIILERNYFEEDLYNNFITDVLANTEVYEANVQKTKEDISRAIEKVSNRLEKDNSSLTFSKESLKEAIVFGQVDSKFIATMMRGKSEDINYLVLFDQHAVHERITLENNLTGYLNDNIWKSVELNDMCLTLSEDKILYLHNYKGKFERFGLNWTILNNHEIKVLSIPAAILGQNAREVDKIIEAVKHLINEEIINIISQKGCVSLYPKTIMNLVSNEACRNAIKFGDSLSKTHCRDLLSTLSTCKTPFQCAHGRPVMAIIMDFKSEFRKYQINPANLMEFKMNLYRVK